MAASPSSSKPAVRWTERDQTGLTSRSHPQTSTQKTILRSGLKIQRSKSCCTCRLSRCWTSLRCLANTYCTSTCIVPLKKQLNPLVHFMEELHIEQERESCFRCVETPLVMSQGAQTATSGFPKPGLSSALLRPHFSFFTNTLKVRQGIVEVGGCKQRANSEEKMRENLSRVILLVRILGRARTPRGAICPPHRGRNQE